MAGGFGQKSNSKSKTIIKTNSNEIIKDSVQSFSNDKSSGVLSPGQSVDIHHQSEKTSINWSREFLSQSAKQEQSLFINQHSQEIKQEIEELRFEIKKLIESADVLNNEISEIEVSVDQNIIDFSEYQLNFFQRIKKIVVNFQKNISEASIWMESFNHKKNRRNAFWNRSKSGGQQYQQSGEHSASRSAN